MRALILAAASIAVLAACSAESAPTAGGATKFSAEIRRTAFGVPHIKAANMGGIGYGYGYASAQDNVCEIADRLLTVAGQRAKYLGPGENDALGTTPGRVRRRIFARRTGGVRLMPA
jgi:acyl-homoserine-lactone acylase